MKKRFNDLNTHLRSIFGCRVQKITVDAGLSCPNRDGTLSTGGCIYCNARGSGTGAYAKGLSITEQILQGKKALARRYKAKKFIAYFQSFSNTYAPFETLRSLYEEALAIDGIVGLSIGTRPDCVDEPILDLLRDYAKNYLIWMEYGLQSAHDKTLRFINRGHDLRCFKNAVNATKNRGIKICAHVILGLPGEQRKHMLETAKTIAQAGIHGIKLHLLYVIKGTKLEKLYQQGAYTCLEQHEYADLICDVLEYLPPEMVIQRLTGDPHPEELVAPMWSLKKSETLTLIKDTLEKRDSYQGKKYESPVS
ncbi:TIGR01212 family radical SAM protein [Desulfonema magnum]|uniref:Radical SAM protein, YhcC-like n=1 Tax=Desulfonema magnum TaxID=45655 RepID=A0A975GSL0_9BACT|nr:TIGR01212 family radical SAM protein [Desulfonema magnum]QTA91198.1 Radical SAM protein, YhcC-like [Desulfonema magnum]